MSYTVKQLSKLAGVSIRTLHYYDKIGLLKPAAVHENGYRYYGEKELAILQQVLFFKELEFSLESIKEIMYSENFSPLDALEDQRKLLSVKKKRVEKLLKTIDKTIQEMKGGVTMSNNDKFSAFNDPTYQKYKDEVYKRWGNTDAYKQSMERVRKMSKEGLEQAKAEAEDITQTTADLMKKGYSFDSAEVQMQVDRFYQYLHHFYDPSYELFKGLGQMYVDDPRFTKVYEKRVKGFAVFMRDAMAYYAKIHLKKDD